MRTVALLAAAYACYQLQNMPMGAFAHFAAALTAGRPVFGCVGWLLINNVHRRPLRGSLSLTSLASTPQPQRARRAPRTAALAQARTLPAARFGVTGSGSTGEDVPALKSRRSMRWSKPNCSGAATLG